MTLLIIFWLLLLEAPAHITSSKAATNRVHDYNSKSKNYYPAIRESASRPEHGLLFGFWLPQKPSLNDETQARYSIADKRSGGESNLFSPKIGSPNIVSNVIPTIGYHIIKYLIKQLIKLFTNLFPNQQLLLNQIAELL
ncbi:hypothetical protein B5X24_HaOG209628 [Helicoverpa armigera]|nr:hypothetical protein B5X24_HaOG209628 [Helicoverpa armigera]